MSGAEPRYEERIRAWSSTEHWRAEAGAFLDVLALPRGARVLDVGMGAGALQPLLRARDLAAFGLDRWDGWTARGDGRTAVQGDARGLPFAMGTFDAVVFHHVLAHLDDQDGAIREARRVLRPAGRLGIATPNARFIRAMALPSRLNGYRRDPTVARHFSRGSLCALLQGAGLRIRHAKPWGKLPWPLPLPAARERLFVIAEVT